MFDGATAWTPNDSASFRVKNQSQQTMIASSLFSSFLGIPLERGVCSGGLHREKVSKDKLLDFCSGIEKETKRFRLAITVQFSLLCFFGV